MNYTTKRLISTGLLGLSFVFAFAATCVVVNLMNRIGNFILGW